MTTICSVDLFAPLHGTAWRGNPFYLGVYFVTVYHNIFESWADVQSHFNTDAPEPFKVLYAAYEYEDYSGYVTVLWRNEDGSFGMVNGSHCSCNGLEDQWDVEEISDVAMRGELARRSCYLRGFRDIVAAELGIEDRIV
jgi:hypothetical protein